MAMQQEPIDDGGTDSIYFWPIVQAYFSGNIPTKYGQTYGTFTYLHFRILKFPLMRDRPPTLRRNHFDVFGKNWENPGSSRAIPPICW